MLHRLLIGASFAAGSKVSATWTAGGNMAADRDELAAAGTQSAALAMGGRKTLNGTVNALRSTEEYDGTSWTYGGNLSTSRWYNIGSGTQTAGLAFGGSNASGTLSSTEEYNKF